MSIKKDQILIKAKEKNLIKGLRHIFVPLITEKINTKKQLIKQLEKLREQNFVEKKINIDKEKIYYKPTIKSKDLTNVCLNKNIFARLKYFKELWNITYKHIEDRKIRLYEIGIDLNNNYGVNIYPSLKKHQDKLKGFEVDEEILDSLKNNLKN